MPRRSSALSDVPSSSTGSPAATSRASAARATNSGAGGIPPRAAKPSAATTSPASAVDLRARRQGQRRLRLSAGARPTTAVQAASSIAQNGGTPTSGRATFSAANAETKKNTSVIALVHSASARYQGSNVASSARITSTDRNATFGESRVVLAQYAGSRNTSTPW